MRHTLGLKFLTNLLWAMAWTLPSDIETCQRFQ